MAVHSIGTEGHRQSAMRVLLVRHAETAAPHVFHGAESDIGLSERGQRQALALAPILADYGPVAVISSGMRRARETALPVAEVCRVPLGIEPALHERKVGPLSGAPFATGGIWQATLERWIAGETSYAPEGAESYDAIRDRVLPIWQRLADQFAGQCIAVITHGVVCKVLLTSLIAEYGVKDWARLGSIRNAALNELSGNQCQWELVQLNVWPPSIAAIAECSEPSAAKR